MNDNDDQRFGALMNEARTPTSDGPDWDDVVRRSRQGTLAPPHRRPRLSLALSGLGVVGLMGVLGTLFLVSSKEKKDVATASYAVLGQRQTPRDYLPKWVAENDAVRSMQIDPTSTRLVLEDGRQQFWLARQHADPISPQGTATPSVCLIDAPVLEPPYPPLADVATADGRGPGGVFCREPTAAPIIMPLTPIGTGTAPVDVVGIVPDGIEAVSVSGRAGVVGSNVFVIRNVDATEPIAISLAGVTVIAGLGIAPPQPHNEALTTGTGVAVLARPLTPADTIPSDIVDRLPGLASRLDVPQARLLAERNGERFWVVPASPRNKDQVWIIRADVNGGVGAHTSRVPNAAGPIAASTTSAALPPPGAPLGPDRFRSILSGLVVDGLTNLRIDGAPVPIANNFYLFDGDRPATYSTLEFTGPGGRVVFYEPNMDPYSGTRVPLAVRR